MFVRQLLRQLQHIQSLSEKLSVVPVWPVLDKDDEPIENSNGDDTEKYFVLSFLSFSSSAVRMNTLVKIVN